MAVNFGREYSLIIGRPEKLVRDVIPKGAASPQVIEDSKLFDRSVFAPTRSLLGVTDPNGYVDYNTLPERWVEFTGERISGKILYNKKNSPPCTVRLYNADPEAIRGITKDDLFILRLGYSSSASGDYRDTSVGEGRDSLATVFSGQVVYISTSEMGEDVVTDIVCGEAATVRKNSKIVKSWVPGTTRLEVIQDLINAVTQKGIPLGRFTTVSAVGTIPLAASATDVGPLQDQILSIRLFSGYSVAGYLLEELERVCSSMGYRSYMSLGKLYVEPNNPSYATKPVVKLSEENIKYKIKSQTDNVGKGSADPTTGSGILVYTYLDGNISPDKLLEITDGEYKGSYTIESVSYEFDNRGPRWDAIISCNSLK